MAEQSTWDEWFAALARAFLPRAGVSLGSGRRGFGSDALQVDGRIFAMARRGDLVLKLPSTRVDELVTTRVDELVTTGMGAPFDAGKGRPKKEWVIVPDHAQAKWQELAEEALAFVAPARS